MKSAALIVPAYNEARTVAQVLDAAMRSRICDEVVCVDDGSSDGTANAAANVDGAKIVSQKNCGKAIALKTGLSETKSEVVAFLDADLIGLTPEHIVLLVSPVVTGKARASVGIFKGGRGPTDLAQKIAPMISGQRCLERELLIGFDRWDKTGFGIEHALNDHLKAQGVKMLEIELCGASHLMKEEKRGFLRGFAQRIRMYADIIRYNATKRRT